MNSYLLRRLFPFYIVAVAAEFIFTLYSICATEAVLDESFFGLVKTFGILLLTTTSAFLAVMVPYVVYLMLLPQKWQNGRGDKYISYFFYFVFALCTIGEEFISAYFWQKSGFPASLAVFRHSYSNFDMLAAEFFSSDFVEFMSFGCLIILGLLMYFTARYTLTAIPAPKFINRVFQTAVYAVVCVMTYANINAETLAVSAVPANNELSKEGTYTLIKETVKNYQGTDFPEE